MNETESLRARVASLEAEIASHFKRRAAINAMEAYKTYATTHAQEIADEAVGLYAGQAAHGYLFPHAAEYLRLRNEADRLRKDCLLYTSDAADD